MPEISRFYGIVIYMYFGDHPTPHLHARYGEFQAKLAIRTGAVLRGKLPPRALRLVREWIEQHQIELLGNWELCSEMQEPSSITPLD
jgi:hypothetical protein